MMILELVIRINHLKRIQQRKRTISTSINNHPIQSHTKTQKILFFPQTPKLFHIKNKAGRMNFYLFFKKFYLL